MANYKTTFTPMEIVCKLTVEDQSLVVHKDLCEKLVGSSVYLTSS